MSVILKKLEFSNMFSYGENNSITLNDNRITQLNAMNGCLSGDSILIDANGYPYTIKEIVDNKLEVELLGVDESNKPIKARVLDWFEHKPKQLFKVQLDNGNLITITDNHLLKTPEGWKPLKELKVDDWIVDSRNRDYTFNRSDKSDDWWELITYLLTEGGLSEYRNRITFTNNDEQVLAKFETKLKSISSRLKTTQIGDRPSNRSIIFDQDSTLKRNFIQEVCVPEIRGYSYEKHFPKEIFSLPDSVLDKIFAIYLETDGCIESRGTISFSTSSIKMGYQLLHLLRYRYGLQCSSRIRKTYRKDNMEILITRLDNCKKFINRVGPYVVGYKREKIESLLAKTSNSSSYTQDLVPVKFLKGLRSTRTSNNPYNCLESKKAYSSFNNTKHGITRANYELLTENSYISKLKDYKDTRYLRIKKIEPLDIQPVYDVQTTAGNFIAGDTLVHNSGKTSISLILQELLYNKNVKKLNKSDILNKYSEAKQWKGKVFFSVGAKEYELTVTRKNNSSTVTLLEDGTDISEHKILDTYKKIHSIIGRDFEVFSQLTYQSSTNLLEFLKATDANRKKFLISLFNLEKYLAIGDKIKLVLGETDKKLIEKNAELKTVQSFLTRNALPEKETEIEVPQIDETLKPKIEVLELEIAEQLTTYRKIDKNNNLVKERDGLVFDMASKIPELEDGTLEKLEATKKQINILSSKLQDVSKQLRSLDTSDVCYACKQPIDNSQSKALSDALESEKTSFEQELEIKREDLKQLASIRDKHVKATEQYEKNLRAQERFTQLSQLIDTSLPQEYPDYKKLNDELKVLKQELEVQTDRHQKAIQYNQSVKIRNAKIDGLVEQIVDFKARQQLLENDILKIQDKANNLAILKKAFSTSGIVAYKLENVAKQLEESINHYLAVLSDGQFQVIFRLSGEKLNIVVVNNGEEVSIDSLSGGEFSRVQTSVLLAVRNTLSTIGGNSINLLFLDEIMAVLDDTGKERLFEVLQEEKELNVFLVSHEYSHPLIPRIEITKKDNISYIDS